MFKSVSMKIAVLEMCITIWWVKWKCIDYPSLSHDSLGLSIHLGTGFMFPFKLITTNKPFFFFYTNFYFEKHIRGERERERELMVDFGCYNYCAFKYFITLLY